MTVPGLAEGDEGHARRNRPVPAGAACILFQYNPETMTRTLQAQAAGDGGRAEAMRLKGPPIETFKLDVEIDATDQLDTGDRLATALGIHPQLAALETLIYPASSMEIANTVLLALGTLEVIPPWPR